MNANCRKIVARLVIVLLATASATSQAALDLRNAKMHTLNNGLTVLTLEEHSFPLVSVQALYRSGARDEVTGRTGLAHFVEHMAFRDSDNFPDTQVVSKIYAAGGEWHGYTYLDQTTYFSTVPSDDLDLLLRIEADRMSRLDISPADIDVELGAILAEMHGYENDPATVLHDWALYTALVAHPYRNNTIGWESDVRAITCKDVQAFYDEHYQPGNAVLAIVGDFDEASVMRRVSELFGGFAGRPASPLPATVEPLQTGERRIHLTAQADSKSFQFVWRAPAATDPDYPAFVLMQEVLSASNGVNFGHNDWGTPAREGSFLYGIGDEITTWMMPTAQSYVFTIKGSIAADGNEKAIEDRVADVLRRFREQPVDAARFKKARARLQQQLHLDVLTTEDAAHQLAFFDGIDALDVLLRLPATIDKLTPADVQRVAQRFLTPEQRTVAWIVPGDAATPLPPGKPVEVGKLPAPAKVDRERAPAARVLSLDGGVPVILQSSPLSPTVHLEVIVPGLVDGTLRGNAPVSGFSAFSKTTSSDSLDTLAAEAAAALAAAKPAHGDNQDSMNPYARSEQILASLMATPRTRPVASPVVIVLAGDVTQPAAIQVLNRHFGKLAPATPEYGLAKMPPMSDRSAHIPRQLAQAHLAWVAPAPGPDDADAYRALLYILSHGYEGRLGKKAISERGLVYYIDAEYRSDGKNGWVTLSTGVDPSKLDDMEALMRAELARLQSEPPTTSEVADALRHRIGRAESANQSNRELADALATEWLWYGQLENVDTLRRRLAQVEPAAVRDAVDAFTQGAMVRVSVDQ